MMRMEWRNRAYQDAMDIADYIDLENPVAAFAIYEEIKNQIETLLENPHLGRPRRVTGTRELIINRTPFIAAYSVTANTIFILILFFIAFLILFFCLCRLSTGSVGFVPIENICMSMFLLF